MSKLIDCVAESNHKFADAVVILRNKLKIQIDIFARFRVDFKFCDSVFQSTVYNGQNFTLIDNDAINLAANFKSEGVARQIDIV